ncbi:MAG TPA: winged helix-turn-helix domain-containing protein [Pyrinomonadaceae bacterium]|nr:winged helix-turn-helix domain-containing protein [Pyrinomonadaceae bacterium]
MAAIAPNQTPAYEFGAFQLIPAEHQLLHQGVPVPLPPKAFETLVVLVEKSGHLVEKEELMRTLWPDSFVEEANLTHHIWTLRKALGEGENGTRYIETVPRRGYRFVADVRQSAVASSKDEGGFPRPRLVQTAPQATADDLGASTTMSGADQRGALDKSWTARGYLKLTAFALAGVLVGSAIAVYRYSHRPPNATEFESVAVTPFINESGKPELDYLADDLYESMISDLARMPRLSVFRYRGKSVEAKKVASDLSVQGVLTGRLVQHGENVTVYLTLVDGRTGREVWGEQYNRKLTDLVSLQSDVSRDVSEKLRLTSAEKQHLAKNGTQNNEAYQAYINGRYFWQRPGSPGYPKSAEYFQRAIDLDPNYASAYAGLAHYYGFGAALGALPPDENWPKSEAALNRAIAIDDSEAESFNALAGVQLYYHRDWAAAERSFRRGVEINPNSAETHHHYARCLYLFGRNQEAITEFQRAIQLDPLSLRYQLNLGILFYSLRDYDRAINEIRHTLELEPNFTPAHEWLGNAYKKKGLEREAVAEWSRALVLRKQTERATELERNYTATGFASAVRTLAEHRIEELNEGVKRGEYVAAIEFVSAYVRMGKKDLAFTWLERALQERNRFAYEIKIDPQYDDLRNDPRFAQLLRRSGFIS